MDIVSKHMTVTTIIQDYGFPIVAVFFLAYFIYFLWKFITTEITPKLSSRSSNIVSVWNNLPGFASNQSRFTLSG